MTSTTTFPLTKTDDGLTLDRVAYGLMLAFVGAVQVSIAAAQILLTLTLLCWAALLVRDRARPEVPPFFVALLAYAGITLVASAFSIDPLASVLRSKQLVLFLVVPVVYTLGRGDRSRTVLNVVLTIGAISATLGIFQYAILHYDNLGQRPDGAMSHWMTYSGLLMLVLCAAIGRVVLGRTDRTWPALMIPALVVALELTLTRSAWVGASVAVGLLLMMRDFRLAAGLPVLVALLFALAPDGISNRMLSTFDLKDPTNRDRLAMIETGAAMIKDDPLTGVGPNMVQQVYPRYRSPIAVKMNNQHLHNVPLQIAAERGLPALAIWLWFIGALVYALARLLRSGPRVLPGIAIAAVGAMLAAGMFEYNFGDSEFLMLFLVIVTLPFAERRGPA